MVRDDYRGCTKRMRPHTSVARMRAGSSRAIRRFARDGKAGWREGAGISLAGSGVGVDGCGGGYGIAVY